ncbi:General transcription factor IIH subunit 4 [Halotydeus destructor]|nr:General transcription factor IIH subunit 4 [Halotydeus destructor]
MNSLLSKRSALCKTPNLQDYFKQLSPAVLEKLYTHPATCLAIFRDLTELAKHYVMRLLFVESSVPHAVVASWVNKLAQSDHEEAVRSLNSLKIWSENPMPGGLPGWLLKETFRKNLKVALLGGGKPWEVRLTSDKDKHSKDIADLDSYSTKRWELLLHYMVGSNSAVDPKEVISVETKQTLDFAGLVKVEKANEPPSITADGFQFLLMDMNQQVWYFMLKFLETVDMKEPKMDLIECLTFLFQLSFSTLGQVYSSESMSKNNLSFLQNLRDFGLVYQRKRKDSRFYPTRLAINLITGLRDVKANANKVGYAIVETNYRVYAYTESPLQIALLGLFTELQYRFPSFCLGILSRDSVREALKSGITAEQIIHFLTINAHPSLNDKSHRVPPTITDQIRLWEIERNRFIFKDGVLYSNFLSQGDFELLRNYARDNGCLTWENPSKRFMVVTDDGHDAVRTFWKRHKKDSKKK